MDAEQLFEGLRIPADVVVEFFVVFARFEFALKDAGFVFSDHGRASPDWHAFQDEVAEVFVDPSPAETTAFHALTDEPPWRQMLRNGRISWEPTRLDGPPVVQALAAARQVRHNLFHGGKHTPHSPEGRDAALVSAAITVLNACLQRHQRVREAFDQPQSN